MPLDETMFHEKRDILKHCIQSDTMFTTDKQQYADPWRKEMEDEI